MKEFIYTKDAPEAIGPYSQGVKISAKDLVFVSGQIPVDPKTGAFAGDTIEEQTRQSILNIQAVLAAAGMTLDNVIRTTVYLSDIQNFGAMNKVYEEFFGNGKPARAAVEVANIPKGALVEIDAIAAK